MNTSVQNNVNSLSVSAIFVHTIYNLGFFNKRSFSTVPPKLSIPRLEGVHTIDFGVRQDDGVRYNRIFTYENPISFQLILFYFNMIKCNSNTLF